MSDILLLILFGSIVCIGINKILSEGMLLERIGNIILEIFGEFWSKPISTCPPCMASVHGTWIFFLLPYAGLVPTYPLILWPIFCIALSGLNFIMVSLFYNR